MRRAICTLTILFAATALLAQAAGEKPAPKKSRRPKSTTRVITNEDVKKSKGKVIQLPDTGQAPPKVEATLAERHATLTAARAKAEERVRLAEEDVSALARELERLERAYLEEDDLDVRDAVIAKQFAVARVKADAAATELDAARKSLAELPQKP